MESGTDRPATDAALRSGRWVVGERYLVIDGLGPLDISLDRPTPPVGQPPRWWWPDKVGQLQMVARGDRLPYGVRWTRLILDASPDPRTRAPRTWVPSDQPGLADELAALADRDEKVIATWVRRHGFVGLRAEPRESCEGIDEIRESLLQLRWARQLVRAIRELRGDTLRARVEEILGLEAGLLKKLNRPEQPLSGPWLAAAWGMRVPPGQRWTGAGAHVQAFYWLRDRLTEPLRRYLQVRPTITATTGGMRLQATLVGTGPLAAAYLQTLDEASWPAITFAGTVIGLDWRTPRPCGHCGRTFRPSRRDQKWCSPRCRWASSKARAAEEARLEEPSEAP